MEIEFSCIDLNANIYDVRKADAAVLNGPDLYCDPNDREIKAEFPILKSSCAQTPLVTSITINGKAVLRVDSKLKRRLIKWNPES